MTITENISGVATMFGSLVAVLGLSAAIVASGPATKRVTPRLTNTASTRDVICAAV
ncbi:hypothetical protein [Arthrobacter sp. ZGTC131]|uniref:hypothetical protein n=1 Tax=Arthrobacter sp. ZGTC131 TaxID=2058898 RepID=UPI0015E2D307|nr:hypothetical protein [Arthrobacter sp. ZGTC131]